MDDNEEKGRQNEEPPPSSTASPAPTAPTSSSSSATPPSSTPSGKKAPLAKQASTGGEKKILIHLKAVGDTPSLMKKNWDVGEDKTVAWLLAFLRGILKLQPGEQLFLFVNQSFSPSPEHTISSLKACFGGGLDDPQRLVLNYSKALAWG